MKELDEMKAKNEEILKRWRSYGFLKGLKEGSINEWRCAKSFQDMADFISADNEKKYASLYAVLFACIRRILCTGKKRLHRLLKPEELIEFFEKQNAYECWVLLDKDYAKMQESLKKTDKALALKRIVTNFLEMNKECTLLELFNGRKTNEKFAYFEALVKGCIDWEADLLVLACHKFVDDNTKEKEGR